MLNVSMYCNVASELLGAVSRRAYVTSILFCPAPEDGMPRARQWRQNMMPTLLTAKPAEFLYLSLGRQHRQLE
eukprot:1153199-Amphidinium_carterae.1